MVKLYEQNRIDAEMLKKKKTSNKIHRSIIKTINISIIIIIIGNLLLTTSDNIHIKQYAIGTTII